MGDIAEYRGIFNAGYLIQENAGYACPVSYTHLDVYKRQLYTRASMKELTALFPDGQAPEKDEENFLRLDYTYEVKGKDEFDPDVIEGSILDIHPVDVPIREFLFSCAFTVNAMADNPERGFVDPYDGREDLKKKLIRPIGDPSKLFQNEPIRMMEAVRLAAELGFDLQKSI